MVERQRDLSILTPEKLEALQGKLANRLNEILNNASLEANKLLNQYGVEVKIGYVLEEKSSENP